MKKNYPIGIQSFEEIRKGNYCYIDKTALVYKLAESGKYYFLSRPRRFGKSLLISTLEAYFQGRKELFEGLSMGKLEKEWTEYPILHLDLNAQKYDTPDSLYDMLNDMLCGWESRYGTRPSETSLSLRFQGIIQRAAEKTGRNVVILIDEYDKPMLQVIGNEELMTDYRNTLKAFYGVMKSCDKYIKFALLTGVTKFSKVSVFSDLNNLMDISSEDIYNPFSLLNTFAQMRFGSYWFETGTPTFLVELLKHSRYNLYRFTEEMADADSLEGIDTMHTNPVPILYQSGYLTIKGYDKEFRAYYLGFPNKEVEEGLTRFLSEISW